MCLIPWVANGKKGWRLANETERAYGGCNKSLYGAYRKNLHPYSDENHLYYYFQCQESVHDWVILNENYHLMIETQGWKESTDGDSRWGDSIRSAWDSDSSSWNCYVYDTSAAYKGWRKGEKNDCALDIPGCTESSLGRVFKGKDDNYYDCVHFMDWNSDKGKYESVYRWKNVTKRVADNVEGLACLDSNDGSVIPGKADNAYFVCIDYLWRDATTDEERECREREICTINPCDYTNEGKVKAIDGVLMVCNFGSGGYGWREANCAEQKTKRNLCAQDGVRDTTIIWGCEDMGNFKIDYVCYGQQNSQWFAVTNPNDYPIAEWRKIKAKYYTQEMHPSAEYGADLVDARDNEVYKTVVIGGKRWMAENLRSMDVSSSNLRGQVTCPTYNSYGWYSDPKGVYCELGRFYSRTAAMNVDPKWNDYDIPPTLLGNPHRGACPEGWHIPDTTEWLHLLDAVDGPAALQAMGYSGYPTATDASGFSALPWNNEHYWVGEYDSDMSSFWTASGRQIFRVEKNVAAIADHGGVISVRCVEDDPVAP